MDLRDSFSKLKKKVKHLGRKKKSDRTGVDADGESVKSSNPVPRPEPHTEADDGKENRADTDGWPAYSPDQLPRPDEPEQVPASEIENVQEGGEAGVDGRKHGLRDSHPNPDIEGGAGSGPSREGSVADGGEGKQSYSSSSTPSNPRVGEPDGA